MSYRIVQSPYWTPAQLALAPTRARIEDAVADMGEGIVLAPDGHVVAFHEKHERALNFLLDPRRLQVELPCYCGQQTCGRCGLA